MHVSRVPDLPNQLRGEDSDAGSSGDADTQWALLMIMQRNVNNYNAPPGSWGSRLRSTTTAAVMYSTAAFAPLPASNSDSFLVLVFQNSFVTTGMIRVPI